MTGEQFHDALTLLPEDLVAKADEIRCRKPTILPWKRYAAMAACLAVLLCSAAFFLNTRQESVITEMAVSFSAVKEEAAEDAAAPRMEIAQGAPETSGSNAAADSAAPFTCVETPENPDSTACGPSISIISAPEELDAYCVEWDRRYLLDTLRNACSSYDEDWFASHDLLLIPVDGVSVGQSCTVTDMTIADGVCEITIALNGEKTDKLTNYHIVLPVEKDVVTDTRNITIIYNSDTIP